MPKTRDDFMPDAGAFLDNMDGDIVDVEFTVATGQYADKVMTGGVGAKPPVILKLTVESSDMENPANQTYSVGSQDLWEIRDDGKSIVNVKNPDRHIFRKGSRAWALVEAIMTAVGDGNLEKGQDFFIKRDTYMTEANFYKGLSFHWAIKSLETVGGEKTNTPLPERFWGEAKPNETKAETVSDLELDMLLVENAKDKTERELKSLAVRNAAFKKNTAYLKAVVSGKKLKELEEAGTLTKDPETGKYV